MDQRIKQEQLKLLFSGLPTAVIATVLLLSLTLSLSKTLGLRNVGLACGGVLIVTTLRLVLWLSYRRYSHRANIAWSTLFIIGCIAAGISWGAAAFIAFPEGNLAGQSFIAFLLAGVSAGAVTALAADRRNVFGFILPCIVPLIVRFYFEPGPYGAPMAVMTTSFLIVISASGWRTYQQIYENIVLRLEASEQQRAQQRSERALAMANRQLRNFVNAADHVAIIALDSHGIITTLNRGAEKMLGYAASELGGKLTLELLLDPDELQDVVNEVSTPLRQLFGLDGLLQQARERGSYRREFALVSKQGQRICVDLVLSAGRGEDDQITGFIATAIDVSERKSAAQELQRLNERFKLATHSADMGIWDWDIAGGKLVWDQRTYEIYCAPRDLKPDMDYMLRVIHPDDFERARGRLMAALKGEQAQLRNSFRIICPSGEERMVSTSGLTLRNAHGRAVRMTGLIWDMTEHQRVERMKNEFVATVSHELRTPLTSIRGSLGLVAAGAAGKLPERAAGLVKMALNNCERLTTLINDILDIEKLESEKQRFDVRRMDVAELVQRSLDDNAGFAQSLGVRFTTPEPLSHVEALVDPSRLLQVMANLLSNASKFSPSGASIEVTVRTRDDRVRVAVRDYGKGIPPEFQPRVFQKFSQADSSDTRNLTGTGLGLAISRAIVERLGGTIGFETGPGGTTFYFELPDANSIAAQTLSLTQPNFQ